MEAEQASSSQLCILASKWYNFQSVIGLMQTDRVRKLILQVAIHFFFLSVH